jgi:hypothetical protein
MKYFKDFLQFKNLIKIFEQEKTEVKKTPYEEKMGDESFDIKARKRKKGKKLDYTLKYDSQDYKEHPWNGAGGVPRGKAGSNYQTKWVKDVENAFNKPETREKMVEFLKNYKGQDYQTVQRMIATEVKKSGEENLWKSMLKNATDGKVGPYHRIVWNGMIENKIPVPELPKYEVITGSNPEDAGTTKGDGTYDEATSVTVEATPNEKYEFINWTEANQEVSNQSTYTFQISSDRTLLANFKAKPKDVPDDDDEDDDDEDENRIGTVDSEPEERSINTDYARVIRAGDKVGYKLGEEEKMQRRFEMPKGDNKDKILNLDYPSLDKTIYSCNKCGFVSDILLNECPKSEGGCGAKNSFEEEELDKESIKNTKVKLGRVENLSDKVVGDDRTIAFDCVMNVNEFLKVDVYVYIFYQRLQTKKKEDAGVDVGVMRKIIKGGQGKTNVKFNLNNKTLVDFESPFVANIIFSTKELEFGKDQLSDPNKPFKFSKDNPKFASLIKQLSTTGKDGMIRSFLMTMHKGPLYSTARVKSSPK